MDSESFFTVTQPKQRALRMVRANPSCPISEVLQDLPLHLTAYLGQAPLSNKRSPKTGLVAIQAVSDRIYQ